MKQKLLLACAVFASVAGLVLLLACLADLGAGRVPVIATPLGVPTITGVVPSVVPNDLDVPIVIQGTGFAPPLLSTYAVSAVVVTLNDVVLADAGWVNSTTVTATVPWGLAPGSYTVMVRNPDGLQASAPDALTITQGIGVLTTDGPYGGQVGTLLINPVTPTTVYAAVSAPFSAWGVGVFRSLNGGESWDKVFAENGNRFHAIALSPAAPSVIYVYRHKSQGDVIYRSEDGGDTWTPIPLPIPRPARSPSIRIRATRTRCMQPLTSSPVAGASTGRRTGAHTGSTAPRG
jgi:hypothetical protein